MARRAREINAERLSARLDVENPHDELGLLSRAFNETLARLERSFEQLRRFTSNASHELRTPLTAIRSVGEVGLQRQGSSEYYREVIGSMLEESARLTRLVDSLLTIARADSGEIRLERTPIFILPFVREAVSFIEVLAEEKHQKLSVEGNETARVHADRVILRQVLVNLLDNAIKYSFAGGHVLVRVLSGGPKRFRSKWRTVVPVLLNSIAIEYLIAFTESMKGVHARLVEPAWAWPSRGGVLTSTGAAWNSTALRLEDASSD